MNIMKLHLINEFSQREIAKELGISQKTVSNRIKKLLSLIQEKLKNWIYITQKSLRCPRDSER